MNNSVLKDLFYGRCGLDSVRITKSARWSDVEKHLEELRAVLNPEQYKQILDFEQVFYDAFVDDCDSFYVEGFKFGVLVGIECAE